MCPGRRSSQVSSRPVEPLELSGRWASVLAASALTRARSSRTSRATTWNFVRTDDVTDPRWAAASTSRTARASTGMMPSLSRTRTRRWSWCGTASARLACASSSHRLLLRSTPAGRRDGYDDIRHAALRPGDADIGGRPGWPSARRCSAHGSARSRRGGSDGPATLWNPRPPFGDRLTATPPRRLHSPNVSPSAVRRQ